MDPVTQGTLGAAAALAIWGKDQRLSAKTIGWLGALAAMAPDLDVLIRSDSDPLLAVEYHRHFTHSLAFVPVGATIALLPWLLHAGVRQHLRLAWSIAVVGYLTHAPLDCCTTYGTQFFWPFSNMRVAFGWVSVVDFIYTLPLLAFVITAARRRSRRLAQIGLAVSTSYLALGALQHQRALNLQAQLIERRAASSDSKSISKVPRREVFTTFMNQMVWRSLYEKDGQIYVDELRVPYIGARCVKEGSAVPPAAPLPADAGPVVQRGERLMRWFSDGWVARSVRDPSLIGDLRYSFEPSGIESFWAIRPNQKLDKVDWVNTRAERAFNLSSMVDLIFKTPDGASCNW